MSQDKVLSFSGTPAAKDFQGSSGSPVLIDSLTGNSYVITDAGVVVLVGPTPVANNSITNAKLAQMAANSIKGNNTVGVANAADLTVAQTLTLLGALSKIKVGNFTYNLATAAGNQTVTGVGFTPRAVLFIAGINGAIGDSIGLDDGTSVGVLSDDFADVDNTWATRTTGSILFVQASGANQAAKISSFNSDGFVLTWTKTGAPVGTISVNYLAIG